MWRTTPTARRRPLRDLVGRRIEPTQETAGVVAVIDASVGREREPPWPGAFGQRVLADSHGLGIDGRQLIRAELAEDGHALCGDDEPIGLGTARRHLADVDLP